LKKSIQSRRVVTPKGIRPATLVIEDGIITSIEACSSSSGALDFGDSYILPGLIDTHVHINEPGRTHWEGFETATRAAAAGGCTCLVDMPLNSIPSTTTVAALEQKREAAKGISAVDYAFWGGCVHGNCGDLAGLAEAGVRGFKSFMVPSGVDEFEWVSEADLRLALPLIRSTGLPLLVHAESPDGLLTATGQTWKAYSDYLASRPDSSELEAIQLLIRLCREYRTPIHIVHLASAEPLSELASARAEGLPITVETCPHYLYFAAEEIPDGATQFKCAPPIRSFKTRDALWNALNTGVLDMIATDHSPCPPALKRPEIGSFAQAWGGIASLSLALSAMHTKHPDITDLVRWMCTKPAALAGLQSRKGSLAPGLDADFTVFNPDAEFTVTPDILHFRHPVTPYLGQRLKGRVEQTFLRGECVYKDGQFPVAPSGRECTV